MERRKLFMAVAMTAIMAGSGFAYGQGMGGGQAPHQGGGSPGGMSSPAPGGGSPGGSMGGGSRSEGGAMQQSPGGMEGGRQGAERRDAVPGEKGKNGREAQGPERRSREGTTGQSPDRERTGQSERNQPGRTGADSDRNRGDRAGSDNERDRNRAGSENERNRTGQSERNQTGQSGRDSTTSSRTNVNVNLTSEQRTRIHEVAVKHRDIPRVSNVNVDIRVGTRIPRTVNLVAVPEDIVTIYPQFRSYRVFIIRDEIVFVDPETFEIVFVLES